MDLWCNEVTAVTSKTRRYMKVLQVIFDLGRFSTLSSLVH